MIEETYRCALCNREMPSGAEVYGMGVRLKEGLSFPYGVGRRTMVELPLQGKTYKCMVTADGSRARMEGWDLVFIVCSEECGVRLKSVLESEEGLFEEIM